jgi:uncharacterized protein (TIGR02147 family)
MPNVFDYTDFRKYLTDYYEAEKKENPAFSYQFIANKAGFKNKGFVYNIINREKVLSKSNAFRISQALGHNRYETEYFESMVAFNQTDNLSERNYLFEKFSRMCNKGKAIGPAQIARKDQYEFYSKWYHVMVRSLIDLHKFTNDFKWLAKMVNPPITTIQAKHSVQLLEKLGLIRKDKNGVYEVADKSITTGKEIVSLAVANFHTDCADLAKRAIQELPSGTRNITGLTLGISQKSYEQICEELQQFQTKVMTIANDDQKADTVYQFNFHLFPASKTNNERKPV